MTGLYDDKNAASSKFWRTKSLLPTGKNKPYQQPGLWFPWLSAVLKEDCCTENRNLPNEASLPCSPLDGVNVQLDALLVGLVVFVFFCSFVFLFFVFGEGMSSVSCSTIFKTLPSNHSHLSCACHPGLLSSHNH